MPCSIDSWSCECPEAFYGSLCDRNSPCLTSECDDIGTSVCEPIDDVSYDCVCFESFSGGQCEVGPCDDAENNPCDEAGGSIDVRFINLLLYPIKCTVLVTHVHVKYRNISCIMRPGV